MSFLESLILGAVQGLTEFLPISSSGHLVLFQHLLGFREPAITFDVILHLGTLLSVGVFFFKDFSAIIRDLIGFGLHYFREKNKEILYDRFPYALTGLLVFVSMVPTAIIGFIFKDPFEMMFSSPLAVGVAWFVMGIILILSRKFQTGTRTLREMNIQDAFLIGLAQGIAIVPGISRSGSTILMGMLCGVEKKDSARFSFYLAFPTILAAGLVQLKDIGTEGLEASLYGGGFVTAAIFGFLALGLLMMLMKKGRFYFFGYYCLIASMLTVLYSFGGLAR